VLLAVSAIVTAAFATVAFPKQSQEVRIRHSDICITCKLIGSPSLPVFSTVTSSSE
jgi:hypothetical protein